MPSDWLAPKGTTVQSTGHTADHVHTHAHAHTCAHINTCLLRWRQVLKLPRSSNSWLPTRGKEEPQGRGIEVGAFQTTVSGLESNPFGQSNQGMPSPLQDSFKPELGATKQNFMYTLRPDRKSGQPPLCPQHSSGMPVTVDTRRLPAPPIHPKMLKLYLNRDKRWYPKKCLRSTQTMPCHLKPSSRGINSPKKLPCRQRDTTESHWGCGGIWPQHPWL